MKINVNNIHLKIKKKKILDGVSFDIDGKVAIVGPNGSGKTMTLSVLSQLTIVKQGEMSINNSENLLKNEDFKQKLGVMIQEGNFDPDKKVMQEMRLIQELKGDKRNLKNILKKYNIDTDMIIRNLPHGKYKILLVIQALMGKPELAILDEPFSGLDILNRKIIEKMLRDHKGNIIITTHLLNEIKNVCNDIVFIKEGKIIQKKKMRQIKNLDKYYIKLFK